jgi:hypothetical protein
MHEEGDTQLEEGIEDVEGIIMARFILSNLRVEQNANEKLKLKLKKENWR